MLLVLHLKILKYKKNISTLMKFKNYFLKNGWCEARENWLKMIREFPEEQFIKADDFKNQSVSFLSNTFYGFWDYKLEKCQVLVNNSRVALTVNWWHYDRSLSFVINLKLFKSEPYSVPLLSQGPSVRILSYIYPQRLIIRGVLIKALKIGSNRYFFVFIHRDAAR